MSLEQTPNQPEPLDIEKRGSSSTIDLKGVRARLQQQQQGKSAQGIHGVGCRQIGNYRVQDLKGIAPCLVTLNVHRTLTGIALVQSGCR